MLGGRAYIQIQALSDKGTAEDKGHRGDEAGWQRTQRRREREGITPLHHLPLGVWGAGRD